MLKRCLVLCLLADIGCQSQSQEGPSAPGGDLAATDVSACTLEAPVVLADVVDAFGLRTDDASVYYYGRQPVSLRRVAKAGGTPEIVFWDSGSIQTDVDRFDYAVDAETVDLMLFGHADSLGLSSGSVDVALKDGTFVRSVDPVAPPGDCHAHLLYEMARSGDSRYWIQWNSSGIHHQEDCPDAPEPFLLAWLAPGAENAVSLISRRNLTALLADPFHVFFADDQGVWRMSFSGGTPELLAGGVAPASLATDGNALYFATDATYRISAPGAVHQIFPQPLDNLVTDGTSLYGLLPAVGSDPTAPQAFDVVRLSTDGGTLARLGPASHGGGPPTSPPGVAVDDQFVYFFDPTGSKLEKTCK